MSTFFKCLTEMRITARPQGPKNLQGLESDRNM